MPRWRAIASAGVPWRGALALLLQGKRAGGAGTHRLGLDCRLWREPSRSRIALYVVSWIGVGVLYAIVRESVLRPYAGVFNVAAQFVGASRSRFG